MTLVTMITIIPSQMEVQHRAVALLGPHRTQRTQRPTTNIDTRKRQEHKKGRIVRRMQSGPNIGLRAFGAQAVASRLDLKLSFLFFDILFFCHCLFVPLVFFCIFAFKFFCLLVNFEFVTSLNFGHFQIWVIFQFGSVFNLVHFLIWVIFE